MFNNNFFNKMKNPFFIRTGAPSRSPITIAAVIFLTIVAFATCKKKETDPELSVSTPTLTFGAAEETKTFEVNSNVDWSLSGEPSWLNVAPKSGKGKVAVTVTAQANAGALRDATLTVTVKGKSAPVKVTQAAAAAKGDGANVSVPAVSGTPTASSITVGAVTLSPNTTGQTAEYAITTNASTSAPSNLTWGASTTFSSLASGATYYVWARSAQNDNYNAGVPQRSAAIATTGAAAPSIEVTVTGMTNLKAGQEVSGASVIYTLSNGTYATTITSADFVALHYLPGLVAGTAVRTSATVVTVPITGAPTTPNPNPQNLARPDFIPMANVQGATALVPVIGTITAGAVAPADDTPPAAPNPTLPADLTIENL